MLSDLVPADNHFFLNRERFSDVDLKGRATAPGKMTVSFDSNKLRSQNFAENLLWFDY